MWLDTAKKKVQFRLAFERGEIQEVPDEMADFANWTFFESDAEKEDVFSPEELKELKALLGDKIYNNQMLCQDVVSTEKYYYREEMTKVEKEGRKSVTLRPIPKVPLRVYHDVGIGNKSDRMAFVIAQHTPTHMGALYSWDMPNADYSDVADALSKTPFAGAIFEHVLPHDMGARQQSDKKFKYELFEEALRLYGVAGKVRVLLRPKDPAADLDVVRGVISRTLFNSIHAESLITALENHCRKYNKENQIFEQRPSKTKYRDLADAFRHSAVDYGTREYLHHGVVSQVRTVQGPKSVEINGVEHSFEGSILYKEDGADKLGAGQDDYGNVPTHLSYG